VQIQVSQQHWYTCDEEYQHIWQVAGHDGAASDVLSSLPTTALSRTGLEQQGILLEQDKLAPC
jgi:hypothetical protein